LLTLTPRVLAAIGLATALTAPFLIHALRDHLPEPPYTDGIYTNPSFSSLTDPGALASELLLTGVYPAIPLLAYICAGLAIGRLVASAAGDASRLAALAARLLVVGVALAIASWVTSSILLDQAGGLDRIRESSPELDEEEINDILNWGPTTTLPTSTWWWLAIRSPHSTTPFDLLHTTGTAMAVLGVMLLVGSAGIRGLRPLATAGAMTLTLYSLHVIVTQFWAQGAAGGGSGVLVDQPVLAFVVQAVGFVTFALIWRRTFGPGPLERPVAWAARRARDAVLRGGDHTEENRQSR